jgi:hypothetical protein
MSVPGRRVLGHVHDPNHRSPDVDADSEHGHGQPEAEEATSSNPPSPDTGNRDDIWMCKYIFV